MSARQIEFGVDWGTRPYWVDADVGRLQQVFWNLLKNAVKFTPQGGRVSVKCWRESNTAVVEVRDSGIGIEPDMLPRIFNAFEQAERTITRQFGGLGLGLTITKALVDLHGGNIEADSKGKGAGATFRVRLPLQVPAGPASPAPEIPLASGATRRGLRILLVEDHADTAKIMKRLLQNDGHQVMAAGDVASALKIAEEHSFDLLLSDLGLPDGSGLNLLQTLRGRGFTAAAIALSGYGQESDIQRSMEAGFAAHVTKPATPGQLREAIDRVSL